MNLYDCHHLKKVHLERLSLRVDKMYIKIKNIWDICLDWNLFSFFCVIASWKWKRFLYISNIVLQYSIKINDNRNISTLLYLISKTDSRKSLGNKNILMRIEYSSRNKCRIWMPWGILILLKNSINWLHRLLFRSTLLTLWQHSCRLRHSYVTFLFFNGISHKKRIFFEQSGNITNESKKRCRCITMKIFYLYAKTYRRL